MASTVRSISRPVGIRYGSVPMPNVDADLATVRDLFDSIPVAQGGSAEIAGVWATERGALIAEITAQIFTFQKVNRRPVADGVVDPSGGTLKLMNSLALDHPPGPAPVVGISATVAETPAGYSSEFASQVLVADVSSIAGNAPLRPAFLTTSYSRRLVKVEGSSIRWFAVVLPPAADMSSTVPHINFTPTPIQGGYHDAGYDSFESWGRLWFDYTTMIGGQLATSGANQVLVIPFYKTAQYGKLGSFLGHWREAVTAVINAAVNDIDPTLIRSSYSFDSIVSSSFSNGWVTHKHFNGQAESAARLTSHAFDLDGAGAHPPSNWLPDGGAAYIDKGVPHQGNPVGGAKWYVGGRWSAFNPFYGGRAYGHACCRNHLLHHALWQYCTA
jgi:hypothetical protein